MILKWTPGIVIALALAIFPAFAEDKTSKKGYEHLALGDSISFGFDPTLFLPPHTALPEPNDFIGYPEIMGSSNKDITKTINASCPGETSGSFINAGAPDNGCNGPGPDGQPPFKYSIGLHEKYIGAQLTYAVNKIGSNPGIRLVTLSIGGNDLSLLQKYCSAPGTVFATCVTQRLPFVLASFGSNLALILNQIRHRADYSRDLILVTNYVPNKDPLFILAVAALNTTMRIVGRPFDVKIADGFTAFQLASLRYGGDPCKAGLLVRLPAPGGPNGACDIHPSAAGQALLARAVSQAQ